MKLETPLANLIDRCQTICVAECCGVLAYDFSPVQIASYLTMWRGAPDENEVETLLSQLATLQKRYGSESTDASGVTIEEMNQKLTASRIDELVAEITKNIHVARELIKQSETLRWTRSS